MRLEAEPIRDSMLQVAGLLDPTMFGPGSLDENMRRRSVYFMIKRSQLIPTMMLFDWPEHLVSIGQRATTTIAPQALMFMNNAQGRQFAESFAKSLPIGSADAIQVAYWRAFSRAPSQKEAELAIAFMQRQAEEYRERGTKEHQRLALTDFCQSLLAANEFVYVD